MSEKRAAYNNITKSLDMNHLLSSDQIDIVKKCTKLGDFVTFKKGEKEIAGFVERMYDYIFLLNGGRCYSWIDYITGSSAVMNYLKMFHPVSIVKTDHTINPYRIKMERTK